MNYGLYLSAGGALTNLHRMDVLANNLANANTPGFLPDAVHGRHRLPERLESPTVDVDPKFMLEQLGGGVHLAPTTIEIQQGQLQATGEQLDVAITGKGFFVVGSEGAADARLTRDGRLTQDSQGRLILAASGQHVLGDDNLPIQLTGIGPVRFETDGTVYENETVVGRLRIVDAPAGNLTKDGHNLLRLIGGSVAELPAFSGTLTQHFIEDSSVDPVTTLTDLINTSKAVAANALMMQYHDNALSQTINTFGRVA